MAGLGIDAAGTFAAGFALPETAVAPPSPPEQARFLDYLTRDYIVSDSYELERMPITRQRVWLALSTARGSSTVLRDFGVQLPGIMDAQYTNSVKSAVRKALAHLIEDGSIALKSITIESSEVVGRSRITVEYEDTSTLDSDKVEF